MYGSSTGYLVQQLLIRAELENTAFLRVDQKPVSSLVECDATWLHAKRVVLGFLNVRCKYTISPHLASREQQTNNNNKHTSVIEQTQKLSMDSEHLDAMQICKTFR